MVFMQEGGTILIVGAVVACARALACAWSNVEFWTCFLGACVSGSSVSLPGDERLLLLSSRREKSSTMVFTVSADVECSSSRKRIPARETVSTRHYT